MDGAKIVDSYMDSTVGFVPGLLVLYCSYYRKSENAFAMVIIRVKMGTVEEAHLVNSCDLAHSVRSRVLGTEYSAVPCSLLVLLPVPYTVSYFTIKIRRHRYNVLR